MYSILTYVIFKNNTPVTERVGSFEEALTEWLNDHILSEASDYEVVIYTDENCTRTNLANEIIRRLEYVVS